MKREFLEALGLEKEVVEKIMAEHGKTVTAEQSKVTSLETQITSLTDQIKERDTDIKNLKKENKDNEDLKTKFSDLETKYNTQKETHETAIKDLQISNAIKLAISDKVHDVDLVSNLIDKSKLSLKDGAVDGINEQITALQESKAFLFVQPETVKEPTIAIDGIKPASGVASTTSVSFEQQLAEARQKGDGAGAIKIIDQASKEGITLF